MFTHPQARTSLLMVLTALAVLLTAAVGLATGSQTPVSAQSAEAGETVARQLEPNPRVRFAPLAGRRTPAPLADLEAPLGGRKPPAPLANLKAPLGGRRTPAPLADLEAPIAVSKVPGSALYILGIGAIVLIGALRERLNRR